MRLQIKCKHYSSRGEQMELMVNMEDLFAMLDELKPSVLASYLCQRMKPQVCQSALLVNIMEEPVAEPVEATEKGGAL